MFFMYLIIQLTNHSIKSCFIIIYHSHIIFISGVKKIWIQTLPFDACIKPCTFLCKYPVPEISTTKPLPMKNIFVYPPLQQF